MPGGNVVECRSPECDEAMWYDDAGVKWRLAVGANRVYLGEEVFARIRPFRSFTNTQYWLVPGIPTLKELVETTGCVFSYVSEKNGSRIARARWELDAPLTATVIVKDSRRPLLPVIICMVMGLLTCRA
jgi:hypothetical protein